MYLLGSTFNFHRNFPNMYIAFVKKYLVLIYRSFSSLPFFRSVVFSALSAVARSLVLCYVDVVEPLDSNWNKHCSRTARFESYRKFMVDYPDPDGTESQNNLSTRIDVASLLFISSSEQMVGSHTIVYAA